MRRTILMLAALACAAVGAFTAPVYTNRYVSNGVTYSQFGGVKASNYVATAISDVALVGGYTGTVKRAAYASVAAQSTNALVAVSATNIITASGPMNYRELTNVVLAAAGAKADALESDLREGRMDVAYAETANYALAAGTANAAESVVGDSGQTYTAEAIINAASNAVVSAIGNVDPSRITDGTNIMYAAGDVYRYENEHYSAWTFVGVPANFVFDLQWSEGEWLWTLERIGGGEGYDYGYISGSETDTELVASTQSGTITCSRTYIPEGDYLVGRLALTNDLSTLFSKTGGVIAAADGGYTSVRINGSLAHGTTNVTASGEYSYAGGDRTTASGKAAHAEGVATRASGEASHASGVNVYATQRATFGAGLGVNGTNSAAFVWSGQEASPWYGTHGKGTFNVDPIGGINGFWLGNLTLQQAIVAAIEDESADTEFDVVSEGDGGEVTNTVSVKSIRQAVVEAIDVPTTPQAVGAYPSGDGEALAGRVNSWESYWDGTNVHFEVTNYYGNTTGEIPRLRIRELRDGAWTNVWDEATKFNVCYTGILHQVAMTNAELVARLMSNVAPRAWGTYTDKGVTNVVGNCVWMTSPETYFAGGTEYQRIAVGSGAICVLTANGAAAHTMGEAGTFRFQDEGGTNYFGFAKSESYTIGCDTDGISVENGLVTLRYDVVMGNGDVPIVYWRLAIGAGSWVQLNNADGTACDGAPYSVTWFEEDGSLYAAINCGDNPSGFFKAETSVAGDVVFETNMKVRLDGGIACTNTATHSVGVIRPSFNGTTVQWTWSAK